jgi:hypothetical protein
MRANRLGGSSEPRRIAHLLKMDLMGQDDSPSAEIRFARDPVMRAWNVEGNFGRASR